MKTVRLSEVCKLVNGGTPKSGVTEYWGGEVAWLTPAEMGKRPTPYFAETARTISRTGLANCSARQVPVGAVIMSTRAPIGHLAIPKIPMAFNQGCRGLIPNEALDTKYLYYFLWFSRGALNDLGTGATFKELSSGALANYPIPLPRLEEQRRIVAVLDEAFAAIATATANTEKNLTNAREFFEAFLSLWFQNIAAPKRILADACERVTVGHVGSTSPYYRSEGIPFLRTQNVTKTGIRLEELAYITPEFHRSLRKSSLKAGDVLISRVVTERMNVGVVPVTLAEANCANVICVRPGEGMIPEYLSYLIQSEQSQRELLGRRKGSAQQVVNTSVLKNWRVPVPTPDQQIEMVERLDAAKQKVDDLKVSFERKLSTLAALRQSILHRAFAGELTAEIPDLVPA